MDKYILDYGMIIIFIIIFFLVINLKKCLRNKENFALLIDDLPAIHNEINKIYNIDVESMRNLGAISKSLLTGTNTFTPSLKGTSGTLTIPTNDTILQKNLQVLGDTIVKGNIEIMGQTKFGTTIIDKDGNIKAGAITISANGKIDTNEGNTSMLPNGDINIGPTKILAIGDIIAGSTTIFSDGNIITGITKKNGNIINGTSIFTNGNIKLNADAFLTSPDGKGIRISDGGIVSNFTSNWNSKDTVLLGQLYTEGDRHSFHGERTRCRLHGLAAAIFEGRGKDLFYTK